MQTTLTICDQKLGQPESITRQLVVPSERMTVRELIRERVYQEVQDRNRDFEQGKVSSEVLLLVQPVTPGGGQSQLIDWKEQYDVACRAFETNQIIVLIGEQQATSLDEGFDVTSQTTVVFVRLQMLVGG